MMQKCPSWSLLQMWSAVPLVMAVDGLLWANPAKSSVYMSLVVPEGLAVGMPLVVLEGLAVELMMLVSVELGC